MKRFLQNHKLLLLSLFFLFFRLINLTHLPIFNDEAIYLDWGWRETHEPGYLFYSLYDAKQPLLMWLFGISEHFFSDPLFAGRLVSVCFGLLSMILLYNIGNRLFTKNVAVLASFLYIIIPIFSFFDRQALIEGPLATIGLSALSILLSMKSTQGYTKHILLGLILGIGYMMKGSALIFFLSSVLCLFFLHMREKQHLKRFTKEIMVVVVSFLATNILLFLQPVFWETLPMNAKYLSSFSDGVRFIPHFLDNLMGNMEMLFFFLTPGILLIAILGSYQLWKSQDRQKQLLLLWIGSSLIVQAVLVRSTSQRYLVSFLPVFVLVVGFAMYRFIGWTRVILFSFCISIAFFVTLLQIHNPAVYIRVFEKVSSYAETPYIHGFTSGYTVAQIVPYLRASVRGHPIAVGIAENAGNPENALIAYFAKEESVKIAYLDAAKFQIPSGSFDCLRTTMPLYYVAREDQIGMLDRFVKKERIFYNPFDNYFITLYAFKTECSKPLQIQLQMQ